MAYLLKRVLRDPRRETYGFLDILHNIEDGAAAIKPHDNPKFLLYDECGVVLRNVLVVETRHNLRGSEIVTCDTTQIVQ